MPLNLNLRNALLGLCIPVKEYSSCEDIFFAPDFSKMLCFKIKFSDVSFFFRYI